MELFKNLPDLVAVHRAFPISSQSSYCWDDRFKIPQLTKTFILETCPIVRQLKVFHHKTLLRFKEKGGSLQACQQMYAKPKVSIWWHHFGVGFAANWISLFHRIDEILRKWYLKKHYLLPSQNLGICWLSKLTMTKKRNAQFVSLRTKRSVCMSGHENALTALP